MSTENQNSHHSFLGLSSSTYLPPQKKRKNETKEKEKQRSSVARPNYMSCVLQSLKRLLPVARTKHHHETLSLSITCTRQHPHRKRSLHG